MLSRSALLTLLFAAPGAPLAAQVAPRLRADSLRVDPAVRVVAATYARVAVSAEQVPLLRATLRLADSVLATGPAPATAALVFRYRSFAALSLSRELRHAAVRSTRCEDANAARVQAVNASDGLFANTGPNTVTTTLRTQLTTWHLARAEEDSTARLVARLCASSAR